MVASLLKNWWFLRGQDATDVDVAESAGQDHAVTPAKNQDPTQRSGEVGETRKETDAWKVSDSAVDRGSRRGVTPWVPGIFL